jgi:hypothetical protein
MEPLYGQALAINEKALGVDHRNTRIARSGLEDLLHVSGAAGR